MIALTHHRTGAGDSERRLGIISLARPEKRNALTPEMLRELASIIRGASATTDAIVLAGEGRSFCAGFDLKICHDAPDGSVMRELLTHLSEAIQTMRSVTKPVIIAAHGAAIAGGCALLGGADIVVSHASAKLGYPVTRIGVSPAISAPFLMQNIAPGACRERLLLPELITGEAAHRLGLVHVLADESEQVLDRATAIAGELALKPPTAYAETKKLTQRLESTTTEALVKAGLGASLALTGGDEERAFLARLTF